MVEFHVWYLLYWFWGHQAIQVCSHKRTIYDNPRETSVKGAIQHDLRGQSTLPPRKITLLSNLWWRRFIETCTVWQAAPSYFNAHIIQFSLQEVIYHVSVAFTIDGDGRTIFIFKKVWTDYAARPNPHQTVTFSGCYCFWCNSCELVSAKIRQFCLLTYPWSQKWASSLKIILPPNIEPTSKCCKTQSSNTRRFSWSFTLSSWVN